MPWIILHANGEELSRHELTKPIVIGRATDCDIPVKDIMLSRSHCRIEPVESANGNGNGGGWRLVDLGSRNGTLVGWDEVKEHVLREGDHVRMGRTRMIYFGGAFVPATHGRRPPDADRVVRPSDPHEALSGTVTDFVFVEEDEAGEAPATAEGEDGFPSPQPRTNEPESSRSPTLESFLSDMASSVWVRERDPERDYPPSSSALEPGEHAPRVTTDDEPRAETVSKPRVKAKALPRVVGSKRPVYREVSKRQKTEADLSLQADAASLAAVEAPPLKYQPAQGRRRVLVVTGLILGAVVATGIMVTSFWVLTLAP